MLIDDLSLKTIDELVTIEPNASAATAIKLLTDNNIGALPVCDDAGELVGILSERDIVRGLSQGKNNHDTLNVSDLMTSDVVTCTHGDDVDDIMAVMNDRKIRHVPVVDDGLLNTIVSSRDIMYAMLDEARDHARTMSLAYEMVR